MVKTRTALFAVTYLSAAIGYVTVMAHVHPAGHAAFWALAVLSVFRHGLRPFQVSRRWLNLLAVSVMVLSLSRLRADFLVEPLLDGMLILTGIKLLEAEKARDYMQIYLLCLFLLLGSGLMSLSASFLFYMVPLALLLTVSLMLLAFEDAAPGAALPKEALRKIAWNAGAMCVLSLPVAALLFLILPRTNFPLLNFLNQAAFGRTGFAESVRLGEVASIQEDSAVVFRAQMAPVDQGLLYWRGIVLDAFDGITWRPSRSSRSEPPAQAASPQPGDLRQVIYMEPYGLNRLFGLDRPVRIEGVPAQRSADGTFRVWSPIFKKTRYVVWSRVKTPYREAPGDLQKLLALPGDLPPRIRRLGLHLTAGKRAQDAVRDALAFLQSDRFRYALNDLPRDLESFLFDKRKGNCEYFASALAVLLRLGGVPCRLVGGYRGGYYNETGGYYLVLQKHAHVWTECYLPGKGWIRLDPTPPLAGTPALAYGERLLTRLRLLMDIINYHWFRLVVDYDVERQLALVRKARTLARNLAKRPEPPQGWKAAAAVAAMLALLTAAVGTVLHRRRHRENPGRKLRRAFASKMRRYGYELQPWEGLEEFVLRLEARDVREKALEFVRPFNEAVYRKGCLDKATVKHLTRILRDL
ncbi:Transglutaminase-like enzyme, putative cysteine protease [Desulfacinum hydrothermale DSM 13146]|uniref:Transglutaminase-like enzyme, putative cysteine protease n=1 Tax=Desulfacinum hydrothermale DSM 13146 TaxID=1121390 RepID=A0A1W1X338_9BACT|nr:DUF3488 and transglutaminase-like domain-containing protein [Desulfacinum hydrothermale]SMC18243.1 Transglutaminase-like enzyme, putative cysteine protease [Desulfacinum hydrothermale DSM 13146]